MNSTFVRRVGTFFSSSLITCTPQASDFKHLDYFPLVNSRAHKVGDDITAGILNVQFKETYNKFLLTIVEKHSLDNEDWLNLTYYLLLQDRVSEAMQTFQRFDSKILETDKRLQI